MKKLYIALIAILAGVTSISAQNVSFTIKPGSGPGTAKVFLTSNADLSGVVSQTLLTFTLPGSIDPAPEPVFTLNPTFSHLAQTLNGPVGKENVDGVSSWVFTFYSAFVGATQSNITSGVETEIGEVNFNFTGMEFGDLKLVNLPDGGSSFISFLVWEIGGLVLSNTDALCYGDGAVNGPSGFSGYSFCPLSGAAPVKFLSFYALKNGDDAKLLWTVESDIDNDHFEIERSVNGRTYTSFARVNALNNGKSTNTYDSKDISLSSLGSKVVYYRIKQVEKNGVVTYSAIRNLNVGKKGSAVSLYPNPVRSITKLVLDAPEAGKGSIVVRDAAGKQVQVLNVQFVKGINQQDINVNSLAAGEYNLTVIGKNLNETIKFSKTN